LDESGAIQAVYDTIDDNKATLVSGLDANGFERELECLSETIFDSPTGYYAVAIHCENAVEFNDPEFYNGVQASPYRTTYDMLLYVADVILYDTDDVGYGSVANDNFRLFCDRIVKLFRRDQQWFPSSSSSPKFRIYTGGKRGREVSKENVLPYPEGNEMTIGSIIRFTLSGCND